MSSAVLYAAAALLFYGLADFVYKMAAAAGVRPHHFMLAQAVIFSPLVFIYSYLTNSFVLNWFALWGALAGLFVFIGLYNFSRSLVSGSVSINAPIFRLSFIITAVLAIVFLGEAVTALKLAGLGLALVAVWLLLGGMTRTGAPRIIASRESLIRVGFATLAFGAGNFCHKVSLSHGVTPLTSLCFHGAVFITTCLVTNVATDGRLFVTKTTMKYGLPAALLFLGGMLCLLESLTHGQASVMVPIAQMGFIVTAALGIALLGEGLTVRKAAGLTTALVALVALALS